MAEPKKPKTGGRTAGTPNKSTAFFKQAVMTAFEGIGGVDAFTRWAKRNKTVFYTRIAARMIPTEVGIRGGITVTDKRGVLKQIPDAVIDQILSAPSETDEGQVH